MFHQRFVTRIFPLGALGAAILLCSVRGNTETERGRGRRQCATAYETALELEKTARLRQAKDLLWTCAESSCGVQQQQQCIARYLRLEEDIPSVVPLVTDDAGDPRVDVQVKMDGQVLTSQLDGRALPIDPGLHEFSFSTDGAVFATQKTMILQGQRNRPIAIAFNFQRAQKAALDASATTGPTEAKAALEKAHTDDQATGKPAPENREPDKAVVHVKAVSERESSDASPAQSPGKSAAGFVPYLIGGAGLAAIGGFGVLTYWGRQDNETLAQCSPSCRRSSVDHVKDMYLVADISLGVGIAAVGAATTWLLLGKGSSNAQLVGRSTYRVGMAPSSSGAFATVSGSF